MTAEEMKQNIKHIQFTSDDGERVIFNVLPEWIPVSEKLPPLRQHVLLSAYGRVIYGRLESEDGNSGYPLFYVCTSVGDSKPVYQETTVHSEFTTSRITAWMPLPEPYREDGGTNDE